MRQLFAAILLIACTIHFASKFGVILYVPILTSANSVVVVVVSAILLIVIYPSPEDLEKFKPGRDEQNN